METAHNSEVSFSLSPVIQGKLSHCFYILTGKHVCCGLPRPAHPSVIQSHAKHWSFIPIKVDQNKISRFIILPSCSPHNTPQVCVHSVPVVQRNHQLLSKLWLMSSASGTIVLSGNEYSQHLWGWNVLLVPTCFTCLIEKNGQKYYRHTFLYIIFVSCSLYGLEMGTHVVLYAKFFVQSAVIIWLKNC